MENDVTDVYVHAARTVPGIREIEDFHSHVSLSPVSLNRGRRRVYNAASFRPPPSPRKKFISIRRAR